MNSTPLREIVLCIGLLLLIGAGMIVQPTRALSQTNIELESPVDTQVTTQKNVSTMQVQYLEIVTQMVNETCDALADAHGVVFSHPIPELGNARTAQLKDGGRIGVRAPMGEHEKPVVRPYVLVDDIKVAVKAAEKSGAQIAIPPMEIPGQGTFSIYILGGIEHGLWEL